MKVRWHAVVSTAVSAGAYALTRSASLAAASFATGWLIDGDHLLDYVREHGVRFDLSDFFDTFRQNRYRRILILLHAWEWPLLLFVASALTAWHPLLVGAAIGWFHHLVLDQLTNTRKWFCYSLTGRAVTGFSYAVCFSKDTCA